MILIDANLLIYAYDTSNPFYPRAKDWLEDVLSRPEPVRLAWVVVIAFLRITTHSKIMPSPFSIREARDVVDQWFGLPQVGILQPGSRHWPILRELLPAAQVKGPLVTDAYLAALAIEHGATLCSTDRDFSRFEGLRWRNPMA